MKRFPQFTMLGMRNLDEEPLLGENKFQGEINSYARGENIFQGEINSYARRENIFPGEINSYALGETFPGEINSYALGENFQGEINSYAWEMNRTLRRNKLLCLGRE